jgi:hypothetical protein
VSVGAAFIPTTDWVCSARCFSLAVNVVMYRDRHHLTATFSRLLSGRLEALVAAP